MSQIRVLVAAWDVAELRQKLHPHSKYRFVFNMTEDEVLPLEESSLRIHAGQDSDSFWTDFAAGGLVDWQAIRNEIVEEAGRGWDNWEEALQLGGLTVSEYSEFIQEWYELPADALEEQQAYEGRYARIWERVCRRFNKKLADFMQDFVAWIAKLEQTEPEHVRDLRDFGDNVISVMRPAGREFETPELALAWFCRELFGLDQFRYFLSDIGLYSPEEVSLEDKELAPSMEEIERLECGFRTRMVIVDLIEARYFEAFGRTRAEHVECRVNQGLTEAFINAKGQWIEAPEVLPFRSDPTINREYGQRFWKYVQSIPPTQTVYIVESTTRD